LKNLYKNSEFEIIKIPLKKPMNNEWFLDYSTTESLKVNGECIRITWLPHLKELSEDYYGLIFKNVKEAVEELLHRKKQRTKKAIALGPPKDSAPPSYEEIKHVREFC